MYHSSTVTTDRNHIILHRSYKVVNHSNKLPFICMLTPSFLKSTIAAYYSTINIRIHERHHSLINIEQFTNLPAMYPFILFFIIRLKQQIFLSGNLIIWIMTVYVFLPVVPVKGYPFLSFLYRFVTHLRFRIKSVQSRFVSFPIRKQAQG